MGTKFFPEAEGQQEMLCFIVLKYQGDGHSTCPRLEDIEQQAKTWHGGKGSGEDYKALMLPLSLE